MVANYRIERISTNSLHDFLDYFDHRAFLNDEDWAGCYCQAYLNEPDDNGEAAWEPGVARQRACDRIGNGEMDGYLIYSGEKVLGWCAAGSSKLYPEVAESVEKLASIVCLSIDPDFRNQGVAGALLDLVIEDLARREFEAVDATPKKSGEMSDKGFRGSVKMYQDRGFEKVREHGEHFVLMRKQLA